MFRVLLLAIVCALPCAAQEDQPKANPVLPVAAPSGTAVATVPKSEFAALDIFHVVGIPNSKRNNRVNLILMQEEMRFEHKDKMLLVVPWSRVRSVEVISGERHYGKATYGAAIATPFAIGALFILKKRNVDTMILEYANEHGGLMNVVVQFPQNQGVECGKVMSKHGIEFVLKTGPANLPLATPAPAKEGETP